MKIRKKHRKTQNITTNPYRIACLTQFNLYYMKCTFLFSGLGLRLRANRNDDVHKKIRQYIYREREKEKETQSTQQK